MPKKVNAVVIGAGVGGLAAGIRLAVKGYQVTLLEANAYPGGKLTAFSQDGYRFDAGPSLFTMPEYLGELFSLAGKNLEDYLLYTRLPEVCRYFYPDGSQLTAWADANRFAEEAAALTGEEAGQILAHLEHSREIYALTERVFLRSSLHKLSTYLSCETLYSTLRLHKIDALRTLHQANAARFSDPRLIQLFDRYATYNGSDPYRAPATLRVIPHLEFSLGAYFPTGGMHQITLALERLAIDLQVQIRYNTPAEEILSAGKQVVGVRTPLETFPASVVISNADIVHTYRRLLPHLKAPERLLHQPKSTSGVIFYWGINRVFPTLGLHNIFFSRDYAAEFAALATGEVAGEPTIYLNISNKYAPADAPPGSENWFVMVNTPHDSGQPWNELIPLIKQNVLRKLSSSLGTDIASLIQTEAVLEPRLIATRTGSFGGALYGNASNTLFSAFLRHPNFSHRLKGLYFCGGSVHPGGGIPLALQSARIAVDCIGAVK